MYTVLYTEFAAITPRKTLRVRLCKFSEGSESINILETRIFNPQDEFEDGIFTQEILKSWSDSEAIRKTIHHFDCHKEALIKKEKENDLKP